MGIVLLHLSDIHVRSGTDTILKRADNIAQACYPAARSADALFIIVSGDVAFSGKAIEYEAAMQLLQSVEKNLADEVDRPVHFVVVPGNHDCDFDLSDGTRDVLVEYLTTKTELRVDDSMIETCTRVQKAYFDFQSRLQKLGEAPVDRLWLSRAFDIAGKKILFDAVNVSWVSQIHEDVGKLYFPVDRYEQKKADNSDLRILVLHHPLNWFSQPTYRPFRTFVRRVADIVVTGHEHQGTIGVISDAESDESAYVEGCVLQSDGRGAQESSFNIVQIDLDKAQFCATQYEWKGGAYSPREQGSWTDYHDLPARKKSQFPIEEDFAAVLDDPGAYLLHGGRREVTLADIFVFPNLENLQKSPGRQTQVSASKLSRPEATANGVLLQGDEKSGRTSLLRHLYRAYHDRGFAPLFVRGQDLRKIGVESVESTIGRAVSAQYGADRKVAFDQLSKTKKLLLLDDFDACPLRDASARANVLCLLRERFDHVVVTTSELFNVREAIEGASSDVLKSMEHYRIQQFGFVLRGQLISKWFSLSADSSSSRQDIQNHCDRAEKTMDVVMARSLIPRAPIYLLTLLQSIEAGRSGDFKDSALGHYFQYLITESLSREGVKPEKLTELFQYCAQLAWHFHCHRTEELSEVDLRTFNTEFSSEWHTVDFRTRSELLVRARILRSADGTYSFRYPYIFYFLKGLYLSQQLADIEVRAYISQCCKHLYVRDNANTVLFLVHHTNDDFVLRTLEEALRSLFASRQPIAFQGDTQGVAALVDQAPKLVYLGGEPAEHRKSRDELRDKLEQDDDDLHESEEEESGPLSLLAQITMLFKTTEILGQVLKNQYSRISRRDKVDLLRELFNGPLRALRDFLVYCEKNPDVLVANIEAELQRRSIREGDDAKRKQIAKNVVVTP